MSLVRPIAAVGAAAATVLILATGCGASADVAAEVAGAEYTVDDLNDYLATTDPDNTARAPREAAADWLSDWVFFSAVELELAERGVAVSNAHEAQAVTDLTQADPSFVPGAGGGDVAIHQRAVVLAALEWVEDEVPAPAVSERLRHLCSRHILVASQAEADGVLALLGGGEDFGFLAVELSQDPGSGSLGGDLGCVVEGSFVAPFEVAAYAAEPGEVVVAESQFGFHVIEVISSGPATAANHPQIDAEQLAFMAEDAELAASERAQIAVQDQRQQTLVELQETVLELYAPQVRIDARYGYWDPEQFRVVLEPAG
ncbi:MAG: peptidylprolyl isomerase [Acidimicrobiaceae bacterium]|nr:peptidylprolyl isomerase [Acidimicrobiaceae bacterium]